MRVSLTVNGLERSDNVEPRTLPAHYLREVYALRATNVGCDSTSCDACTVLLDGESVKSCTVLAAQADGGSVTTLEGLAASAGLRDDALHPVQAAFRQEHGLQCGFCTPGMAAVGLLADDPDPANQESGEGLEGNVCRRAGYHNIVRAVRSEVLGAEAPLIAGTAAYVGDPQVRHRGTIGGSLAHAEPAADLPVAPLGVQRHAGCAGTSRTSPAQDMHADQDYRRHLARFLTSRALQATAARR